MSRSFGLSQINVNNLNLWAHVGVFEEERLRGQAFVLDLIIGIDTEHVSKSDDLKDSVDYSLAVTSIQELSANINCNTMEFFVDKILDLLESLYGPLPVQITLTKCSPPIKGFDGNISLTRTRNITIL